MIEPTIELPKVRTFADDGEALMLDAICQRAGWAVVEWVSGRFDVFHARMGFSMRGFWKCDEAINFCRHMGQHAPDVFADVQAPATKPRGGAAQHSLGSHPDSRTVVDAVEAWDRAQRERQSTHAEAQP